MEPRHAEVAVVGGGIVGLALAYATARRGMTLSFGLAEEILAG